MPRRRLPVTLLLSLTIVGVGAALPPFWRAVSAPALLASQATGAPVSPAQAAPFVGDWTAPITSQMGPMTFAVSVKVGWREGWRDGQRRHVPARDGIRHLVGR